MNADGANVLVECRGLRIGYGGRAMSPCPDFTVGAGDCVAVVGPNGTGKTTLLKCVAGLLKPLAGTIVWSPGLARGGIGYLPQQAPLQRDFPASVREVVESGCQALRGLRPFYSRAERRRADAAMARLGVADLARRCYRELSGGQRQRVLLARAVCGDCRLLLLDEPVSAMRVAKSFRAVATVAALFSVVCTTLGTLVAVVAGTPVGATIVAVDIVGVALFSILGRLLP